MRNQNTDAKLSVFFGALFLIFVALFLAGLLRAIILSSTPLPIRFFASIFLLYIIWKLFQWRDYFLRVKRQFPFDLFSGDGPTLIKDKSLRIDEICLPEYQVWDLFRPFLGEKLVGIDLREIEEKIVNKDKKVVEVLNSCLRDRPLILTKNPTNGTGIYGAWVKISKDKNIHLHPRMFRTFLRESDCIYLPNSEDEIVAAINGMTVFYRLL